MMNSTEYNLDLNKSRGANKDKLYKYNNLGDKPSVNNININDNISPLLKTNSNLSIKEDNKNVASLNTPSKEIKFQSSISFEKQGYYNECEVLSKPKEIMGDKMVNNMNITIEEENMFCEEFGLEEKGTITEDLTSTKIDELLNINEEFLKCKEQFIFHCVKNQPDILAKMFPELFKKPNQNVKQNFISLKRKREPGFKQKINLIPKKKPEELIQPFYQENLNLEKKQKSDYENSKCIDDISEKSLSTHGEKLTKQAPLIPVKTIKKDDVGVVKQGVGRPPKIKKINVENTNITDMSQINNAQTLLISTTLNKQTSTGSIFSNKTDKSDKLEMKKEKQKEKIPSTVLGLSSSNPAKYLGSPKSLDNFSKTSEKENNNNDSSHVKELCEVYRLQLENNEKNVIFFINL